MTKPLLFLPAAIFTLAAPLTSSIAQTDGAAEFRGKILDYNGTGTRHWTVAWVTRADGTFIKSLRKQGPIWTSTHWDSHCKVWNTARGGSASGSQALDGYSSATAQDYTGTNSPVIWTWNCRDASGNLVPDGSYKFWIQYAEDSGQGPHTTNGMLWAKGPAGATNNYPYIAANFTNLTVTWVPSAPPTLPPTITSAAPTAVATVGVPYSFQCGASGTQPITFTASGLPAGLGVTAAGLISGIPTTPGTFNGTLTAANGTVPNATQSFSIVVSAVPMNVTSVAVEGNSLTMSGTGPANGVFSVLISTDMAQPVEQWSATASGSIDSTGKFTYTTTPDLGVSQQFYRLRLP